MAEGIICDMETDEIEYKWVIRKFSKVKILMESESIIDPNKLATISSTDFYTKISNQKKVWNLKLECSSKSTYRIIVNLHSESSRFIVKFYILNDDDEKEKLNDDTKLYFKKSDGDDYSYPIDLKYLTDGKYVIDDELTIICNLEEYGEPVTRSLPSSDDHPNSLLVDFKTLLTSGKYSDITLTSFGCEFKAHKTILSARSPVFAEMFSQKDLNESETNQVVIIKYTFCASVEQFLEFIYTDKIEENIANKFSLWKLADEYKVESLKAYCEQLILHELSEQSVMGTLEVANFYKMQNLLDKTVDYFITHCKSMIKSDLEFESWRRTNPCLFNLVLERLAEKY